VNQSLNLSHIGLQYCCAFEAGVANMDAILTKIIQFADRNERAIDVASVAWLGISAATWMPFLPIPEIPYVTDQNFWISSAVWNVAWWGFAHPMLENHRKKLEAEQEQAQAGDDS
jgi:hypothetical protein